MSNIKWDEKPEENPEAVEDALAKVRYRAGKVKARRRAAVGTATALVVLIVAFVAANPNHNSGKGQINIARGATASSEPATTQLKVLLASDVIDKVDQAESNIQSISGTTTKKTFSDPSTQTTASTSVIDFRQDNKGDTWQRTHAADGTTSERAYAPATGTYMACCSGDNPAAKTTEVEDIDPLMQSANATPLALVRQLSFNGVGSTVLTDTSYDGQPAWQLSVKNINNGGPYDAYDIVVLQNTSIPVDVKAYNKGKLSEEDTVSNLQINPNLTSADFTVPFPTGVSAQSTSNGFVETPLDHVKDHVGYDAFVPQYLPAGFELSTVTTLKGSAGNGIEVNGNVVPIQNQVELVYRKGLQRITVKTLSSQGMAPSQWTDPLGGDDGLGFTIADQPFAIQGGAFNRVIAHTSNGLNGPDIWAVGAHYVLSISGDASKADMAKIAVSLSGGD
jgi:hypothetical protein